MKLKQDFSNQTSVQEVIIIITNPGNGFKKVLGVKFSQNCLFVLFSEDVSNIFT